MKKPFLLVAPAQALVALFLFVPALYVVWLSLNESTFGRDNVFVGFANYGKLLSDPYFWRAFWNTFVLVNVLVYVELGLGIAIAMLFASGLPLTKLMVALIFIPYATSEVVAIVMVKYLVDPQVGMATLALRGVGLPTIDLVNPLHSFSLVLLVSTWQHLPFTFILLYTARIGIPPDLYEAAQLDGARPFQIFRTITFRLLMPAILVALLFRYIFAFRIFSEVWLLTQGGPARMTEVLAVYLYRVAFRYQEFGLASATGWTMVLLSLLVSVFYLRAMYRRMFA
jgi:multiple sugar transport system permease protein